MSDNDQPPGRFGRGERTIIRPNPGARRPPSAPSPPGQLRRRPRRRKPLHSAASGSRAPGAVDRGMDSILTACAIARRIPPACGRPVDGRARRSSPESDHARGRAAAAAARPLAGRFIARLVCEPDGAGRRRDQLLREGHPLGRHTGATGEHRQIHSVRHRRRHRPEHPDRGPACRRASTACSAASSASASAGCASSRNWTAQKRTR